MALDTTQLNDSNNPDATVIWLAKGEDLSGQTLGAAPYPKAYDRRNYRHNTIHVYNPSGVTLEFFVCNYVIDGATPEDHFASLEGSSFTDTHKRIVLFGKLGYLYVRQTGAGNVWIHVLSGDREQR